MSLQHNHRKQQGSIMVEALVGLVIFSMGIVGLLGSMATSAQLSNENRYRAEAVSFADELLGQMAVSKTDKLKTDFSLSSDQFKDWLDNRVHMLPGGQATITFPGAEQMNGSVLVQLSISWHSPNAPDTQRNEYTTITYFN